MTDQYEMALTPEQWSNIQHLNTDELYDHGLAAYYLDGQPFGFTRDDVRVLLSVAPHHDSAPLLRNLASRIAALLPPAP